ncbi:MAG: YceD family protein [Polymorphobacter sp.]
MISEFSRPFRAHDVGGVMRQQMLEAEAPERDALARRFDLLALDRLTAAIELRREAAGIRVTGQIHASGAQPCVATAEPVPFLLTEQLNLLLTEARPEGDEIELAEPDLDTETLDGDIIDLGEITAQALALALDPYPRSTAVAPGVISEEAARAASNPFAVLRKP